MTDRFLMHRSFCPWREREEKFLEQNPNDCCLSRSVSCMVMKPQSCVCKHRLPYCLLYPVSYLRGFKMTIFRDIS